MKIAVSFLKSIYDLEKTIELINTTTAEYLHVDVMDGIFVENKTPDFNEIKEHLKKSTKPLDVHLMVKNPVPYIMEYKNLNPEFITIHCEINKDLDTLFELIKSYGIKIGLSIKPKTPIESIEKYLDNLDNILIMSVEPGKGGQKFDDSILYKIDVLKRLREENNYHYEISIDGGINEETIKKVKNVDFAISGSFICMNENYQEQINKLKNKS